MKNLFRAFPLLALFLTTSALTTSVLAQQTTAPQPSSAPTSSTTSPMPTPTPVIPAVPTMSDKYKNLETDSAERTAWILQQNARVDSYLKTVPMYSTIAKEMWQAGNVVTNLETVDLNLPGTQLVVQDMGFGKPTYVKLVSPGQERILFSTFQIATNSTCQYSAYTLSPDQSYVTLQLSVKGTLEDFTYVIIEISSGAIKFQKALFSSWNSPFFTNNTTILYDQPESAMGADHFFSMDLTTGLATEHTDIDSFDDQMDKLIRVKDKASGNFYLLDNNNQKYVESATTLPMDAIFAVQGATEWTHTSRLVGNDQMDDINSVALSVTAAPVTTLVFSLKNEVVTAAKLKDGYIVLNTGWGPNRWLHVFDLTGKEVAKVEIPVNVNATFLRFEVPGQKAVMQLNGPGGKETHVWDLTQVQWPVVTSPGFWTLNGLPLTVETRMVQSFDGTMVPIQIVQKASNDTSKPHPAYLQTYGGFGEAGYLFYFNRSSLLPFMSFLERGGMLVGTGVRGGNEYGEGWHKAAMKWGKGKTFEDVASVAKYLIDNHRSIKPWITLFGSSNGGYVTAATGLLYQQYFGLIIPHAGVDDQLAKERMDARFGGWSEELLDESIPNEAKDIPPLSPVELAGKAGNNISYLILAGRNDSRVNPAHSYKLMSALSTTNQSNTYLYTINNFGHFEYSFSDGNLAAWRDWTLIWSFVFQQVNENGGNLK